MWGLCLVTVSLRESQGAQANSNSNIQIQKEKKEPQKLTIVLLVLTCLWLSSNFLLHQRRIRQTSTPDHMGLGSHVCECCSQKTRKWQDKNEPNSALAAGWNSCVGCGVNVSLFTLLNTELGPPHLVCRVSVLQSNVRHEVSRTPQTRYICFTNCCCWSEEHTL